MRLEGVSVEQSHIEAAAWWLDQAVPNLLDSLLSKEQIGLVNDAETWLGELVNLVMILAENRCRKI
jgi:hypothetical protein